MMREREEKEKEFINIYTSNYKFIVLFYQNFNRYDVYEGRKGRERGRKIKLNEP